VEKADSKMYSHEGQIVGVVSTDDEGHAIVHYNVDATNGQTGAPLLNSESWGSVGVHTGFGPEGFNVGTLITQPMMKRFIGPTIEKYEAQAKEQEAKRNLLNAFVVKPIVEGFEGIDITKEDEEDEDLVNTAERFDSLQEALVKHGALNMALLEFEGLLELEKTKETEEIVPITTFYREDEDEEGEFRELRFGQLDDDDELNGVGRKIWVYAQGIA